MITNRHSILFLGDITALALSFIAMTAIRFDFSTQHAFVALQAKLFAVIFALWLLIFFIFDLYNTRHINPNPQNIGLLILSMTVNSALAILLFYLFPQSGISPKTNLIILSVFAVILLIVWRRLFYTLFTSTFTRTIGLLGTSPLMQKLGAAFSKHSHLGRTISLSPETLSTSTPVHLLVAEHISPSNLLTFTKTLQTETISLISAYELLFAKVPVELMTDEKAIEIIAKQKNPAVQFLYRIFECIISVVVLALMSPFLFIAIIAIAIEDGRPFFIAQKRVGKNNTVFTIYKLRTMKALAADGSAEVNGAQWADKKDSRITKVGNILRKLHIDEIPQMWSVICGNLALIGPRPERPEIVAMLEKEIPYYFLRHTIKPGFTGWAQIKFRYARTIDDSKEKFEYDLYYLLNQNILLDIGIVLKTIQIIFTH